MKIDIIQGSEEWLNLRRTKITGSDAAIIMKKSPFKTPSMLLEEKLGAVEPEPMNDRMREGQRLEPIAREWYENRIGYKMKPTVHVGIDEKIKDSIYAQWIYSIYSHDWEMDSIWAMCSTDGLSEDGKVLLEIKCGKTAYRQAQEDFIPDYYLCQIQHCLWITNANHCDYLAFQEGKDPKIIKVERSDGFIKEMVENEYEFYKLLQMQRTDKIYVDYDDKNFNYMK